MPRIISMGDVIRNSCRERFGPAPRRFGWYDWTTYLFTMTPAWSAKDNLRLYFAHRQRVLGEGIIVWGHIVQANGRLYRNEGGAWGGDDLPGEVVYCTDPDSDISVYALDQIAHTLFASKGKPQEDAEMQFFSDYLANELMRVFGKPVPKVIDSNFPCHVSTVYFEREHLPGNCLRRSDFPLLLSPVEPRVAMVLPSRYWAPSLVALWDTPTGR